MERDSATIALLLPYSRDRARRAPLLLARRRRRRRPTSATPGRARRGRPRRDDRARRGRRGRARRSRTCSRCGPATCCGSTPRADDGVTLFADEVPVHRGEPGRSGGRRAVQVTRPAGRRVDDAPTRRSSSSAQSTVEAVCGVLEMFAPGQITLGDVAVVAPDRHPLEGIRVPAVATKVSYVDGVTGGNLFVMTVDGARKLAAAMMGTRARRGRRRRPSSPSSSSRAVAEAMNQMMASAAGGDDRGARRRGRDRRARDARRSRRPTRRSTPTRARRTPRASRSRSAASRAGSCSSSRTRSSCG